MNTSNLWREIGTRRDQEYGPGRWHCDDLMDRDDTPSVVLAFLRVARSPGHGGDRPPLYATLNGQRVRVTMASRFGDVGITRNLNETAYTDRVLLPQLSDFGDVP